ncbi:MAG: MFS transporter, partial [Gluconobacter sp.]
MVGIAAVRSEGSSGEPQRSTARATALGIMAALAGLMFGLDTGVVAGALPFIATDFHASDALQGWIVSSMMAGAAFGSLAAGRISSRYGRTGAMLVAAVLFLIGTLLCALAPSALV